MSAVVVTPRQTASIVAFWALFKIEVMMFLEMIIF
jgi:hypothetical protein